MPRIVASTEIDTGPEPVWELFSDPKRYPDYVDATERMLEVPDEFGTGAVYREYGGIPPFLAESEWKVTELEPMRHQVHVGDDGKMTMHLDCRFEPTDGRTRLTLSLDLQPRWFMVPVNAVLWPLMMRKRTQAVLDGTVANAKQLAEAESST